MADYSCFECQKTKAVNGRWHNIEGRYFCSKDCGQIHINRLISQNREIEFRYCERTLCDRKARYGRGAHWWCEEHLPPLGDPAPEKVGGEV